VSLVLSERLLSFLSRNLFGKQKKIFACELSVQAEVGVDGYSGGELNDYIIAKSKRWLEGLQAEEFTFPPHVYSLLWSIQLMLDRLERPIRIIDFGGGAPTIPLLLRQLGIGQKLGIYRIIENQAFVDRVPDEWLSYCAYSDVYDGDECDLLILSSVLPYLSRSLAQSLWKSAKKTPPRFIYFGRTSFLPESYPLDDVFTIQESKFREHGAQVDIGMKDVENNVARYAKRHFKFSEVSRVLEPLGYKKILSLSDDSGLENIKGLGLYSNNSLWERQPGAVHMTHI
jgi:putative methyltransferase (TIGR04325 family)